MLMGPGPASNNPTFLGQLEEFSMEYTFGKQLIIHSRSDTARISTPSQFIGLSCARKEVGSGYECRLEFYDINLVKYWFTNSKNLDKMGSPKQKGVKYIHRILSLIPCNGTHCLMSTHNNLRFLFRFKLNSHFFFCFLPEFVSLLPTDIMDWCIDTT